MKCFDQDDPVFLKQAACLIFKNYFCNYEKNLYDFCLDIFMWDSRFFSGK